MNTERFVTISGCSGGGKSSLINELKSRGYSTIDEPGRRVVVHETENSGGALPWVDMPAFAQRTTELALRDYERAANLSGIVFFDRGLIDAIAALEYATGHRIFDRDAQHRYNSRVFFAPPWPEIYVQDDERRHDFSDAINEYDRLLSTYKSLNYCIELLPKCSVEERADFILERVQSN